MARIRVNMGAPILEPEKVPVLPEKMGGDSDFHGKQIVNAPITIDGQEYHITAVSMGNPHGVVYLDDVKGLDIEKTGPLFENHPCFPDRVNTEFVKILDDHTAEMRVWESCLLYTSRCV